MNSPRQSRHRTSFRANRHLTTPILSAFTVAALMGLPFTGAQAQLSITTLGTAITQNFDTLPSTGTGLGASGGIFGQGWSFLESGTNGNITFDTGAGTSTAGNTYSFGVAGANPVTDRAFGMLQSGNLTSILGFKFTNNTGSTVTSMTIGYTGEVWRRNTATDSLAFSYQAGNVALGAAGYTAVPGLTFTTPVSGTAQALDGNLAANRSVISGVTISGLSIAAGQTVTFRWVDSTGTGSAGMGIDDFSLTLLGVAGGTIYYWAPGGVFGGAGTWDTTATNWSSTAPSTVTAAAWDSSKVAVFGGATAGEVTVGAGGVTALKGIQFSTDGYVVKDSTITLSTTAADNTVAVDSGLTARVASQFVSTAGLIKTGAGTLIIGGTNSYAGGTTVSAGTLQIGDGATAGSVGGNIINNSTVTFNRTDAVTFGGDISGSGAVTKLGSNTLTVSGNNSYSGATTISTGVLRAASATALGATTAGTTVAAGAALEISGGLVIGAEPVNLSGSGIADGGALRSVSGANSLAGPITLAAGSRIAADTGSLTLSGGISGAAQTVTFAGSGDITVSGAIATTTGGLTKEGTGTTTLSGTNTYTGTTTINGGTLAVSGGAAIANSGAVSIADTAGATLQLNASETIGSLAGGGATGGMVSLQANTLTVGDATNTTFAGTITGTGGSLVKQGSGTLTLSGANSYTGGTTISGGAISVSASGALGSGPVALNGGALEAGDTITVSNDLTVGLMGLSGQLLITQYYEGTGNNKWIEVTNIGGAAVDLSPFRVGQFNNAAAETFKTGGNPSFTMSLTGSLSAGQSLLLAHTSANTPSYLASYSPRQNDSSVINFNGDDSIVLFTGTTFTTAGIVDAIGFTAANQGIDTSFVRASTAAGYNLTTGSNATTFPSIWTQVTNATVDTAAANTDNRLGFSSLTGGTLVPVPIVGSSVVNGSATFSGALTLNGDVRLTAATGGSVDFTGVLQDGVNGAKGITKIGAGTVSLLGANTFTGPTVVTDGTLIAGAVDSLGGTSAITVAAGGTLLLDATGDRINDAASLTLSGGSFSLGTLAAETELLGALILTADSTLDFGGLASGNTLTFSGLNLNGFTLTIQNWSGGFYAPGQADDNLDLAQDRLLFTNQITGQDLSKVLFFNDAGQLVNSGQQITFTPGGYELVPIPEPSTYVSMLVLAGFVGLRERRRIVRLVRR